MFDWVNVMAYNLGGTTASSLPQHSSVEQARIELEFWTPKLEKRKLVLGVPFFGRGFRQSSGEHPYKDLVSQFSTIAVENRDTVGNVISYNGIPTMRNKVDLARDRTSGIMIWELAFDAEAPKSLLMTINQRMRELGL
jgi:GH18 family chitinase